MTNFILVLKSGGQYQYQHVNALVRQIEKYYAKQKRIICLTDKPDNIICETENLRYNLPGWWSKMEIFRHTGKCFYIDLDTVIVNDITNIVDYPHKFTALREASLNHGITKRMGSGLIAYNGDYSFMLDEFLKRKVDYMKNHGRGDQEFIEKYIPDFTGFQDLFPNQFQSYKFTLQNKDILLADTRIVYFHGKPKPWEVKHNWIPSYSDKERTT
jgi:hypothetical protein